ncbi:MAG: 5-formyltetrahydrofolate cyclo-ligase [Candidatus Omnitrophica bacterium]|nr:5-formyltetrahydrofolate cyclo-ligase [Candidatus Omnitrophota bacterium]MCB9767385.1 5-formyltetrahydrofolate cyclo-ligase [Candidatus Omnitrophota bacterium]MCB9783230.1 5-formyltetrahydrofolate cyclo-ligase [Candidatus Omnitrophota bacterium]
MSGDDSVPSDKNDLRRLLRERRKSLSTSLREKKSGEIAQTLLSHPAYRQARTLAVTYPVGSEVDLLPLIQQRLSNNEPVCLPRTLDRGRMEFHRVGTSLEELKPSKLGIPEPADNPETLIPPEEIDLLIVPGVGFDPKGNRLGQGGGFFDRYLPRLPERTPRLAVAFEIQIVPSIPSGPHDLPVQEVLTERTIYRYEKFEGVSGSVEETHAFAMRLAGLLEAPSVVRLSGELGAGKTEWVRGFAKALGWDGRVRSPSFSLENVYSVEGMTLYHLDGYRLTHPSHLDLDWFEEILEDPNGIVLLEWPDRFGESVPFSAPELFMERLEDDRRRMTWVSFEKRHNLGRLGE